MPIKPSALKTTYTIPQMDKLRRQSYNNGVIYGLKIAVMHKPDDPGIELAFRMMKEMRAQPEANRSALVIARDELKSLVNKASDDKLRVGIQAVLKKINSKLDATDETNNAC